MATPPLSPTSFAQKVAVMEAVFFSKTGLQAFRGGAPVRAAFEAVAAILDLDTSVILGAATARSLRYLENDALDRVGEEEELPRLQAGAAYGFVRVSDRLVTKVATRLALGRPPALAGSTKLVVEAAGDFAASGRLHVGRGGPTYEGPLAYTARAQAGPVWVITLAGALLRDHLPGETVVLGQRGDRAARAGSVVQTAASASAQPTQYSLLYAVGIPDGESAVDDVAVVALLPGIVGNVDAGAVREFSPAPFDGAEVTNLAAIGGGVGRPDDPTYRNLISLARRARGKATPAALVQAAIGVGSADGRVVASAAVVSRAYQVPEIVVDAGGDPDVDSEGVADEVLAESGRGGERFFGLASPPPVHPVELASNQDGPYSYLSKYLPVVVGGDLFTVPLPPAPPGGIPALALAAAVNDVPGSPLIARAIGGRRLALVPVDDSVDTLQVDSAGAAAALELGLPLRPQRALWLYQDDTLLEQNGRTARLQGRDFGTWATMSGPQTVVMAADKTPLQTYTVTDSMFAAARTGFSRVGRNSVAAWATVLSRLVPGVRFFARGAGLATESLRGRDAAAAVDVAGGSLVAAGVIPASAAVGLPGQYHLDRQRGEVALAVPLKKFAALRAGTKWTRAFADSARFASATLGVGTVWLAVDAAAKLVDYAVGAGSSFGITLKPSARAFSAQLAGPPGSAQHLQPGDWLALWDSGFPSVLKDLELRVRSASGGAVGVELPGAPHRFAAAASVALPGGLWLVCGGYGDTLGGASTRSAALFEPSTGTWAQLPPMAAARAHHVAFPLPNGTVLVYGGDGGYGVPLGDCEVFDPKAKAWGAAAPGPSGFSRSRACWTQMKDGRVIVLGGRGETGAVASSIIYDPVSATWAQGPTMAAPRSLFALVALKDGTLLAAGGEGVAPVASAEKLDPGSSLWVAAGALQSARQGLAAVVRPDGVAVFSGGSSRAEAASTPNPQPHVDLFDPIGGWSVGPPMGAARCWHRLDIAAGGALVAAFGRGAGGATAEVLLAGAWAPAADPWSPAYERSFAVSCVSSDGKFISYAGGAGAGGAATSSYARFELAKLHWDILAPWLAPVLLLEGGVSAWRAERPALRIPFAGGAYTPATAADAASAALRSGLAGADAATYQDAQVRYSSSTRALGSDVAVVARSLGVAAACPPLHDAVAGSWPQEAVMVGADEAAVPELWEAEVSGGRAPVLLVRRPSASPWPALYVGLDPEADLGVSYAGEATGRRLWPERCDRSGSTDSAWPRGGLPPGSFPPGARAYGSRGYASGPSDTLVVTVNNDPGGQRFEARAYRSLRPAGSYGTSIAVADSDGPPDLAESFGSAFDWGQFHVYMRARAVTDQGTPTLRTVWRWTRFGADGEGATLRLDLPRSAASPVSVLVDESGPRSRVDVGLPSGEATPTSELPQGARVGLVADLDKAGLPRLTVLTGFEVSTASRAGNVVSLALVVPPPLTSCGLVVGDVCYFRSESAAFPSGAFTLTAAGTGTCSFAGPGVDVAAGPVAGLLCAGPAPSSLLFGGSPAPADWVLTLGPQFSPSGTSVEPGRVTAATRGWLTESTRDVWGGKTATTLTWLTVSDPSGLQLYPLVSTTASALAAAVSALAGLGRSPVIATSSGSGVAGRAAWEGGVAPNYVPLADGYNFCVRSTPPKAPGTPYVLELGLPVTPALTHDAGWPDEELRVSPASAEAVCRWLARPAVSGLALVAQMSTAAGGTSAQVSTAARGGEAALEVTGGSWQSAAAEVVGSPVLAAGSLLLSVRRTDSQGLTSGNLVRLRCSQRTGRPLFTPTHRLASWSAAGEMAFDPAGPPVWRLAPAPPTAAALRWEAWGAFTVVTSAQAGQFPFDFSKLREGDWLVLTAPGLLGPWSPPPAANLGTFRVLAAFSPGAGGRPGGAIIDAPNAVPAIGAVLAVSLAPESALPGYELVVSTSLWGTANRGTWQVDAVGDSGSGPFTDPWRLRVSRSAGPATPVAGTPLLNADSALVQLVGGPDVALRRLLAVADRPEAPDLAWLRLAGTGASWQFGEYAGTVVEALGKLGLSPAAARGADSYRRTVGLVAEVNRVEYGDPADPGGYPGAVAAGAEIPVWVPTVKPARVSIQIRLAEGFPRPAAAEAARAAVVAVINSSAQGAGVAISSYVAAAGQVQGVVSVVPVSPPLVLGSEVLDVQPYETLRVLDPLSDVTVTVSSD